MPVERIQGGADAGTVAERLRALVPSRESVAEPVRDIVARVRAEGDAAVLDYTRRFDTGGAEPRPLRVEDGEPARALEALDGELRAALQVASENIAAVARAGLGEEREIALPQGHHVLLHEVPVTSAAVYVPGGRAPYPSTVVMGAITGRIAGVERLAVCAPPGPDGELHPAILAACALAEVDEVWRMGGAQAVAALAYGTESVPPVDVIVGPGNLYVQEAKRQVFGAVGIDGFAGPSDVMVLVDGIDHAELAARDLAAQAEHGPGTLVVAIATRVEVLDAVAERLGDPGEAAAALVEVPDWGAALAVSERFAPEHLELIGPAAEALSDRVTRAGCVFVGPGSGTAFGDYVAGSNHVLPTEGAARFASGLSPRHFRRQMAEVRIGGEASALLARAGAPIARAEGFELHARSMEARIQENGSP